MILILGGSGYVGQTFQAVLQSLGIDYKSLSRSAADYSQRSVLIKAIEELKPNFIINAAGYTGKPNVDQAELDKTECLRANAVLPGVVGEVCRDHEIPWGHVSSGCIFTGNNQGKGFSEEDAPNFTFRQNNCSFYSGTKALGEELLKDLSNCYIWRLRIPFHEINSPRNYLTKVMSYKRLLDVENSVSQLEEYVRACVKCWKEDFEFGTYNVTNPGFITTREVVELMKEFGFCTDKEFKFFESEEEFMNLVAKAPRSNCVLDSSKIIKAGAELTEVREAIKTCLKRWHA